MRTRTIFMVLLLCTTTPAIAAKLVVPRDYATIQEAVDAAQPFDTIKVRPGEYAGAVINRVPVIIKGSGDDTRITVGNDFKFWPGEDAFDIHGETAPPIYCNDDPDSSTWTPCGGDGTQIRNLWIDGVLWGAYVEGAADVEFSDLTVTDAFIGIQGIDADGLTVTDMIVTDVVFGIHGIDADRLTVTDVTVTDASFGIWAFDADDFTVTDFEVIEAIHGIAHWSGNVCMITDNEIRDFKTPSNANITTHTNGIIVEGNDCLVADNTIFHVGEQVCNDSGSPCGLDADEFYTGIGVGSGAANNVIVDNDVTIAVSDTGRIGDGRLWSMPLSIQTPNNAFLDNDLSGIGTDGVCQITTLPPVIPDHFYIAGCVNLGPEISLCSASGTPPGCNIFEDNDLIVYE